MRKQFSYNTIKRRKAEDISVDNELLEKSLSDVVRDIPLNRQIISDMEFGVGNRPSLPSCFDDDDFYKSGKVDTVTDIRHSPWDDLAEACNPVSMTPAPEPKPEPEPEPTPTE